MQKRFANNRFMFVSPWLIAASIALMALIIAIFAINNLRRETNLIHDGLYHRGQALGRFVGAGTRASMMQGMEGSVHTQRLIEQASADNDILYIAVLDSRGVVMAHSDPDQVGKIIDRNVSKFSDQSRQGTWQIIRNKDYNRKVFEVMSEFSPFRHRRNMMMEELPEMMNRRSQSSRRMNRNGGDRPQDWCRNTLSASDRKSWQAEDYKILVGLDMTDQEKLTRQAKLHIVLVSLILSLVGFGGWLSLLVAQSYQASQNTLKHIQAFTNLLIMKLPVGIIATEQDGRIKTFNRAMVDMIDLTPDQAVNEKPGSILPEALAVFFDKLGQSEEVFEKEVKLERKGLDLIVHVSSVPVLNDNDEPGGRVLLVHDLTELKKLQKEVLQHDRLVSLGKMAAGVAHEVRNPLSSIKGFATLLGSHFQKGSEENKAAELLINEVERLNRSITELLNYSKPLPLERAETNLGGLLKDSLQLMQTDASELGVELELSVDSDLPSVFIDADRIKQVMLNLCLNSLQSMEEGGRLAVSALLAERQDMVEVVVQDTGNGIAEHLLERITDPYFTTKPEGTGLGLALANKIIDEHGGTINFVSKLKKGTTVIVSLPVKG